MKLYPIIDKIIIKYNSLLYPDYWDTFSDSSSDSTDITSEIVDATEPYNPPPKYEDKYLDVIRQLNKEWQLTKDEIEEKKMVCQDFYQDFIKHIQLEIDGLLQEINNYKKEMEDDNDIVIYVEEFFGCEDEIGETTLEDRNEYRRNRITKLTENMNELTNQINSDQGLNELKNDAENQANYYITKKRIEKLQHSYIMEKTPQGNVLMMYDKDRESFKYYSDSTIPYRYLEVVARKYVKCFNCRPIFIDMEEELKLFDEKWTKEYELKKAKEAEEKLKAEEAAKNNKPIEQKKNVFAKFKSYNKDAGCKISMAAPPKNSIPNKNKFETKEGEKTLLKERANRYTYEGKFANFNFLQKIERKVFNKKLGISFADFKKINKK
jgi:hypothetical protein